jgi:hypothetical protein
MQVIELRDLRRKDTPLHYIREFQALAVLETSTGPREAPLAFTVERKPIGPPDISVRFLEEPDWPLLPLIRSVKDLILGLDRNGGLP